jgi:hypothetical membrane protein
MLTSTGKDISAAPCVLGAVGSGAAVFFLAIFVALHWLDPSIGISRNYVSEYANGPYGQIFDLALLVHGLGNLAITGGFFLIAESRMAKAAATLFGLAAIGVLVAGIFPTDEIGSEPTTTGTIHAAAAFLAFPVETMALAMFALVFTRQSRWRSFAPPTIGASLLSAASLLWLLFALEPGLPERASFLVLMAWELFAGAQLWSRAAKKITI